MYELLIKIMYELDYRKFTIHELEEMKDILNQFNKEVLEVRLKEIKEEKGITYKKEDKWKNIVHLV